MHGADHFARQKAVQIAHLGCPALDQFHKNGEKGQFGLVVAGRFRRLDLVDGSCGVYRRFGSDAGRRDNAGNRV